MRRVNDAPPPSKLDRVKGAAQRAADAAWDFNLVGEILGQLARFLVLFFLLTTVVGVGLYTSKVAREQMQRAAGERDTHLGVQNSDYCRYYAGALPPAKAAAVADSANAARDAYLPLCAAASVVLSEPFHLHWIRYTLVEYMICEPGNCWNSLAQYFTTGWFFTYIGVPYFMTWAPAVVRVLRGR